ncbi:hypothetical protein Tco_0980297 [Tanacetum coccineum]
MIRSLKRKKTKKDEREWKRKVMRECCFVVVRVAWLRGFSFFLQMGFTLILATLDGLDVGLLGDVIGEDDCDDDGCDDDDKRLTNTV